MLLLHLLIQLLASESQTLEVEELILVEKHFKGDPSTVHKLQYNEPHDSSWGAGSGPMERNLTAFAAAIAVDPSMSVHTNTTSASW